MVSSRTYFFPSGSFRIVKSALRLRVEAIARWNYTRSVDKTERRWAAKRENLDGRSRMRRKGCRAKFFAVIGKFPWELETSDFGCGARGTLTNDSDRVWSNFWGFAQRWSGKVLRELENGSYYSFLKERKRERERERELATSWWNKFSANRT